MIVRHTVRDFDAWKPVYDEHGSKRREYGIGEVSLHRGDENPNDVVIVLSFDDMGRAKEFAATDDLGR